MAKLKKSDFRAAREWIDALPEARREQIEAGAATIVKAAHLSELRKAMHVTQTELSKKSGIKQGEISRIENHPGTVQIRTMERYVKSLGGNFRIVADFPDGTHAEIPIQGGRPVKSKVTVKGT